MSMRVDRSSVSDVQAKLAEMKRRKEEAKRGGAVSYSLDEREAAMQEQGERFDELIEHLRGSNNL